MSGSVYTLGLKGVDQTGAAFNSIGARVSKLTGMMGAAFAGIGAYMSFSAVKDGIQYLGHLSDIAMKTGTNADELTSFSNALNMLGIQRVDIDSLGKAFDYMQKTTGRTGLSGMYQTIEELSKIPDTAKRGQEAMRIFGRTGMEFMPLINAAAKNGIGALKGVVESMPGVSNAAANSGDAVADAMDIATNGVKSAWLGCIGEICAVFDDQFTGGIREAAAMAANWLGYYANVGMMSVMSAINKFTSYAGAIGTFWGALIGGEGLDTASAMFSDELAMREEYFAEKDRENELRHAELLKMAEERAAKIRSLQENSDKAAISGPGATTAAEEDAKAESKAKNAAMRNALVMGGSNAALKMSLLGPTMQSETKKQTKLLADIASNTKPKSGEPIETWEA